MRGSLKDTDIPGTLWNHADHSNDCADIKSFSGTGNPRRVCFRNRSDQTVLLCWVDDKGNPHHFHQLAPYKTKHRLRRGDVIITDNDHVESTWEGHAFLLATCDDVNAVREQKSLDLTTIIGGYRPESGHPHSDEAKAQLVEVFAPGRSVQDLLSCCRPSKPALDSPEAATTDAPASTLRIRVRLGMIDPTPLDTTKKPYNSDTLANWPVRIEPDSLKDHIKKVIVTDLEEMQRCLPEHAIAALRDNTPIWINKSLKYGPRACPITAKGMCFHPGSGWLDDMGMCTEKCESVELYNADDYCTDRPLWGTGGLLIHEFSHAYHHKCCEDGYENKLIKDCYDQAMKEGLYDSVEVHGRQGPKAKAYACTDQMEYFAELSTAFLGGAPERLIARGDDDDCEFNKWYPFNRKQIQEHDPRAFEMLKTIWKMD